MTLFTQFAVTTIANASGIDQKVENHRVPVGVLEDKEDGERGREEYHRVEGEMLIQENHQ